jgi:hypothetical protein
MLDDFHLSKNVLTPVLRILEIPERPNVQRGLFQNQVLFEEISLGI